MGISHKVCSLLLLSMLCCNQGKDNSKQNNNNEKKNVLAIAKRHSVAAIFFNFGNGMAYSKHKPETDEKIVIIET